MLLIKGLICFFIILLTYQLFLQFHIIEGLENAGTYKSYDDQNSEDKALILAQQNAGNIEYIKQRMDDVQDMYQQVKDLSGNVTNLQDQVNGLVAAQEDYANELTGGTAPDISGTTEDGEEVDEELIVEEDAEI
jgi:hypothetical protein